MKTKSIVLSALIGALYFVLTVGIAPLSYGPVQFRISEILKVFCLFNPFVSVGLAIGDFFTALVSPFASPWEMIFMPITDLLGGLLACLLYKKLNRYVVMVIYAVTTSFSVAYMLVALGVGGFWLMLGSVLISEVIILCGGVPLVFRVMDAVRQRNITLFE